MKPLPYACQYCGSTNLRRSHRKNILEIPKMLWGTYPFRCLDCNQRVFLNIWLLSHGRYAKCPKCLTLDLAICPRKQFHANFWSNLLITFGAHLYRCAACRYNFVSFRPREIAFNPPPPTPPDRVETEALES